MGDTLKKSILECLGTMALVIFGCGVAVWTGADPVATALTFGLVLLVFIYIIGPITGCHVNPAVSLGAAMNKRITWKEFGVYVASQFVGAIIGAAILLGVFALHGAYDTYQGGLGSNLYSYSVGDVSGIFMGLIVEVILTFIFVLTILAVTSKKSSAGKKAGLIIGLALTLVHLFGIGFTGTSVNPARSFGPALILAFENTIAIEQVWLFLLAPMIGAALAALFAKFVLGTEEDATPKVEL